MAGLVVIDFIDMEQSSHVRKVEKAMKDALKNDRARIQVGRISSFGLMEMSRQRLRTGVLEASTKPCPHCEGTGLMRTAASAGLSALRMIEDEAARGRGDRIVLRAGREAAVYVLNKKRAELAEIEQRYGVSVEVVIDEAPRRRPDERRELGPAPGRADRAPSRSTVDDEPRTMFDEVEDEDDEDEAPSRDEERGGREERREGARSAASDGDAARPRAPPPPARRPRPVAPRWRGRWRRSDGEERTSRRRQPAESPRARVPEPTEAHEDAAAEPAKRRRRRRGRKAGDCRETAASRRGGRARQLADGRTAGRRGTADRRDRAGRASPKPKRAPRARRRTRRRPKSAVPEPPPAEAAPAASRPRKPPPPSRRASGASKAGAEAARPRRRRSGRRGDVPVPTGRQRHGGARTTTARPRRSGWWQRTFG